MSKPLTASADIARWVEAIASTAYRHRVSADRLALGGEDRPGSRMEMYIERSLTTLSLFGPSPARRARIWSELKPSVPQWLQNCWLCSPVSWDFDRWNRFIGRARTARVYQERRGEETGRWWFEGERTKWWGDGGSQERMREGGRRRPACGGPSVVDKADCGQRFPEAPPSQWPPHCPNFRCPASLNPVYLIARAWVCECVDCCLKERVA